MAADDDEGGGYGDFEGGGEEGADEVDLLGGGDAGWSGFVGDWWEVC